MIRSSVVRAGLAITATVAVIAGGPAIADTIGLGTSPAGTMPVEYEVAQARAAENMAESNANVLAYEAKLEAEAKAKKKKAEAKRRAAAKAKAARARAAGGTPAQNRVLGMALCADHGWSAGQCADLGRLWQKESGWNSRAHNSSSGAHGIPQALPGSKMSSHGGDWATSARTQIAWGLDYIARAYGNPSNAWAHSQRTGWY